MISDEFIRYTVINEDGVVHRAYSRKNCPKGNRDIYWVACSPTEEDVLGYSGFSTNYTTAHSSVVTCLGCLDDAYYEYYKEELGIP